MKKLKDPQASIETFFERAQLLNEKLGPVLFQLPPRWPANVERLASFLEELPPHNRYAFEFRDPSWYDPEICGILRERGVALCLHDLPGSATGRERVGSFVYVRFHGADAKYGGSYSEERLRSWAEWLNAQRKDGCDVYAYFNNDIGGHAPRDAATLRRVLEERS